jgi:CheY-like chemotaxis protein
MSPFEPHILVIEPDTSLAAMILEILSPEACRVSLVGTIPAAIACLQTEKAEAMILDADGFSLDPLDSTMMVLRAWMGQARDFPPMIVVSLHVAPDDHAQFVPGSPPVIRLRKPFRKLDFQDSVRRVLGRDVRLQRRA